MNRQVRWKPTYIVRAWHTTSRWSNMYLQDTPVDIILLQFLTRWELVSRSVPGCHNDPDSEVEWIFISNYANSNHRFTESDPMMNIYYTSYRVLRLLSHAPCGFKLFKGHLCSLTHFTIQTHIHARLLYRSKLMMVFKYNKRIIFEKILCDTRTTVAVIYTLLHR